MQRTKLLLLCLALSAFLFSCGGKTEETQTVDEVKAEETAIEQKEKAPVKAEPLLTPAVCLYDGLGLFKEPGTDLIVLLNKGEALSFTGKTAKNAKNYVYKEVIRSNGQKGWAYGASLIDNARAGIVFIEEDEANIYDKPKGAKGLSKLTIKKYNTVAIDNSVEDDKYHKIAWFEGQVYKDKYILKKDIVETPNEIAFAHIMYKLKNQDDLSGKIKKELIFNASSIAVKADMKKELSAVEVDENALADVDITEAVNAYRETTYDAMTEKYVIEITDKSFIMRDLIYPIEEYLLFDAYTDNGLVTMDLYNTSVKDMNTLPFEVVFKVGDDLYPVFTAGSLKIVSQGKTSLGPVEIIKRGKTDEGHFELHFINGFVLKSGKLELTGDGK